LAIKGAVGEVEPAVELTASADFLATLHMAGMQCLGAVTAFLGSFFPVKDDH
jgi:hypothetical protein